MQLLCLIAQHIISANWTILPFIGSIMSNYPVKAKGPGRKYIESGLEFYTSDMGDSKSREDVVRVVILRLFYYIDVCLFLWLCCPARLWPPRTTRFRYHIRRATVGRTHLGEWLARPRDLNLTTHTVENIHAPGGIRNTIAVGERLQTYALDRAATGTGMILTLCHTIKGRRFIVNKENWLKRK
jgi:hypothetical protein